MPGYKSGRRGWNSLDVVVRGSLGVKGDWDKKLQEQFADEPSGNITQDLPGDSLTWRSPAPWTGRINSVQCLLKQGGVWV